MNALALIITQAGLNAFTASQVGGSGELQVGAVGLTDAAFVAAPTLTALPGEFARLATIAGQAVGDNVVHLVARDESAATYGVRGFGLYLADGRLFATYSQSDRVLEKATASTAFLAVDIAFPTGNLANVTFGSTDFLDPPATTTTKGVVMLANAADADAGTDTTKAMTASLVARVMDAAIGAVGRALAGLTGRTISGAGLATGGGDLSADRVLTVPAASAAETAAGVLVTKAVTPGGLSPVLAAALAALIPPGTITLYSGGAAPAGWAICDGSIAERADGSGQFTTPDLRGRVAVGASVEHPIGTAFGQSVSAFDTDPAETGVSLHYATYGTYADGGSKTAVAAGAQGTPPALTDPGHAHSGHVDVIQPSLALHYIIKL